LKIRINKKIDTKAKIYLQCIKCHPNVDIDKLYVKRKGGRGFLQIEVTYKAEIINKKGIIHPRTGHEDLEGEKRYSSTLSSTLALDGGGWSIPSPGHFTPRKDTQYPLYRRLVGPRVSLDECRKSHPHHNLIPGPSSP
jgi:hypothetical protein